MSATSAKAWAVLLDCHHAGIKLFVRNGRLTATPAKLVTDTLAGSIAAFKPELSRIAAILSPAPLTSDDEEVIEEIYRLGLHRLGPRPTTGWIRRVFAK